MVDMIFLKKRQWQDLNLRIQRIIDFKSIALDHSATLSSFIYIKKAYISKHIKYIIHYEDNTI